MLLSPDTLPLYQASRALCCRGGSGGRECTRHHAPGPKLLAPHPAKEAPCVARLSTSISASASAAPLAPLAFGSSTARRRATSPTRSDPSSSARAMTRGHDGFWRDAATVLHARKVVFIPLLIPQPDWDKSHFVYCFGILSPIFDS